jgi:hypothetical protein
MEFQRELHDRFTAELRRAEHDPPVQVIPQLQGRQVH